MILRGLAGIFIGLAYGLFVGVVVFLITHIGLDYEHPGPLIPNKVEWARLITWMAGAIAGIWGALVGLMVGLMGIDKTRAAKIGFISGLLLIGLLSIDSPGQVIPYSLRDLINLLVTLALVPFGLGLMSVVVAIVAARLKSYDS